MQGINALRQVAAEIFHAAVESVDPSRLVADHLARDGEEVIVTAAGATVRRWVGPTVVVGAGKAAARMAAGAEIALGTRRVRGTVVTTEDHGVSLARIEVVGAGHPVPDQRSVAAARRIFDEVEQAREGGILALIGGGASSLAAAPVATVTLAEKVETTRLLLSCGASIAEFNTVRKHLSVLKGGGLLRAARVPMVGLLISDVVGDDPGTIGSGPTAADATTFADALAVLGRYRLLARVPPGVREALRRGRDGLLPETVKPGSAPARRCANIVIGSNRTAIAAAAAAARARGWEVLVESQPLQGDTTVAARLFAARLQAAALGRRAGVPLCVLAGGETTVRVRGQGNGGRNQEFALAMAGALAGRSATVLSAGTDGIDGPTDAAGAFVDGETLARAQRRALDADAALRNNDSHGFFAAAGDLFRCGATGTNVMDLKIALLWPAGTPLP